MASSYCWNCFSKLRPSARPLLPTPSPLRDNGHRATFHTTAPQHAQPPKAKGNQPGGVLKFRQKQTSLVRKNKRPDKPHRFTPQEIKAARKPISVSNANALAAQGVKTLSTENMAEEMSRGQVFYLPKKCVEPLRALQVFKSSQGWPMFKAPGTLMREESVELARLIRGISGEGDMKEKSVAMIVTGDKGTGKSIHLTQAMTMGLLNNWVVINIPEAQEWVSANTAYEPFRDTDKYVQKNATAELLERIAEANASVLSNLHVSQQHNTNIEHNLRPDSSLHDLAKLGASRPELAWTCFQGLWSELSAKSPTTENKRMIPFKPRPPMLVTVDNLPHWMCNSAYFDPEYKPIHSHDFVIVHHFLSLLSASSTLPNGGLVLYAMSTSNCPRLPSLSISLKQLAARNAGVDATSPDFPLPPPYETLDDRVVSLFNNTKAEVQELGGISRDETRKLLEYYALNGLMRERISEDLVGEKWTLSGGGVIGELERFGKRLRVSPPLANSASK